MKVISCLIDFTETSKLASAYALALGARYNVEVNFLHIVRESAYDENALEQKVRDFVSENNSETKVSVSLGDGNYLDQIPKLLSLSHADLVVIGTHGRKGAMQTMVGADVVQLIQKLNIPALIMQANSPAPSVSFSNILFPIGPHHDFAIKTEKTAEWAIENGAHVEILCLITGEKLSTEIERNLEASISYFKEKGISHSVVKQDSKVYGVGYGKDIIQYAKGKSFDLISVMSQTSEENMYFGNVDKTELILNSENIPVLCIG